MRLLSICILILGVVACGRDDAAADQSDNDVQKAADQAVVEAQEIVEEALSGKKRGENSEAVEKCAFFESGLVPEIFGVDGTLVTYRSSMLLRSAGHISCSASWDKPDKAEQYAAFQEAGQAWAMGMVKGEKSPQPAYPKLENEVSIILLGFEFDSPQEAVANLEETVITMSKGVKYKVAGKEREMKMSFGEWEENIGDKAIFTKGGALQFAADAKRYTVNVSVSDDAAEERAHAIAVAQRFIDR